jgi:hypothetical protein
MGSDVLVQGDGSSLFQGFGKIAKDNCRRYDDSQGGGDFATLELDHAGIMRLGCAT